METKAFRVLSDETKMRILNLLLKEECCVCEVMQALEIPQYKASRGLISLYNAGFLKVKREGLWSLYSLDEEGIKGYRTQLVEAVRDLMKDNEIAVLDRERLKKAERVGARCVNRAGDGLSCKATSL